jgi:hypothetical protein
VRALHTSESDKGFGDVGRDNGRRRGTFACERKTGRSRRHSSKRLWTDRYERRGWRWSITTRRHILAKKDEGGSLLQVEPVQFLCRTAVRAVAVGWRVISNKTVYESFEEQELAFCGERRRRYETKAIRDKVSGVIRIAVMWWLIISVGWCSCRMDLKQRVVFRADVSHLCWQPGRQPYVQFSMGPSDFESELADEKDDYPSSQLDQGTRSAQNR